MIDPVDPAGRDPNYDWRTEVDWHHVRQLILSHGLYWAFGAAQAALYHAGMLAGTLRTLIGVVDYVAWAALAVLSMRVIARPRYRRGSVHMVSSRTFLVLLAFMASLFTYILLLNLIDMDTIKLL